MSDTLLTDITRIIAGMAMVDAADLTAETRIEDLEMDSLAIVETLFAIEEQFDISIPFNANEMGSTSFDVSTIASIVAGVEELVATKGS